MRLSAFRSLIVFAVLFSFTAIGSSAAEWACSPWQSMTPEPFPLRLSAVVRARGQFWGFGGSGTAVSGDGNRWERRSWISGQLEAALWTGGEFIGAAGNQVLASPEGSRWTVRHEVWQDPIFFTIDLRSLASDGHTYVAVGEDYSGRFSMWSPVVLTSHGGVVWSKPTLPAFGDQSHSSLSEVVWTHGRFVAVGTYLFTSPDGDTWSASDAVEGTSIASDGEVVVVGDGDAFRVSDDLTTWQTVEAPVTVTALAYVQGRFYAAGRCRACPDREPSLWWSSDGLVWQRAALDAPVVLRAFTGDGTRLVAVGDGAATSGDGSTWTTSPAELASALVAVATDGTTVVAVGGDGELLSDAGTGTWRRVLWGGAAALNGVAWGAAGFVAVGDGVVLVSPDGSTWSRHDAPGGARLHMIASTGQRYVATSSDETFYASEDGVSWTPVEEAALGADYSFVHALMAGGGRFVASLWLRQGGGALVVSSDGLAWQVGTTTDSGLPDVAWGGGRYIATDFGKVLASSDGSAWQQVASGEELEAPLWVGDRFVAWSKRTHGMWTSLDGTAWKATPGPATSGLLAEGTSLWRVDAPGAVERSRCGVPATVADLAGIAHLDGANGTVWRSDLELHNPGAAPATVGLVATPRDEVVATGRTAVTLLPGHSLRLDDVLAREMGVEGLAATVRVASWDGTILAFARTYDDTPDGTFGQAIPPLDPEAALGTGEEAHLLRLAHSPNPKIAFRTNLGLVNVGPAEATADVDLVRSDGLVLGSLTRTLRGGESTQVNDAFRGITQGFVNAGFAVVRASGADARLHAFASVVHNGTGDPTFVTPSATIPEGQSVWLPGAGRLSGINGSTWETTLELFNAGTDDVQVRIALFPRDREVTTPLETIVMLEAGTSLQLEDVVGRRFLWTGAATLRVTPIDGEAEAAAWTFTSRYEGLFGQSLAVLTAADAITPVTSRRLIMLRQSTSHEVGFRANIGLANITATPTLVRIELRRGDGVLLGLLEAPLRAFESVQLNEALRRITAEEVADAYAIVSTATPGAKVLAYGSLIDNRTNDPVLILAR